MLTDQISSISVVSGGIKPILYSISNIFKLTIWLERELSEFTGLFFIKTVDSRKLLLDYLDVKEKNKPTFLKHKTILIYIMKFYLLI